MPYTLYGQKNRSDLNCIVQIIMLKFWKKHTCNAQQWVHSVRLCHVLIYSWIVQVKMHFSEHLCLGMQWNDTVLLSAAFVSNLPEDENGHVYHWISCKTISSMTNSHEVRFNTIVYHIITFFTCNVLFTNCEKLSIFSVRTFIFPNIWLVPSSGQYCSHFAWNQNRNI
jgi:hypothetical protein